MSHINYNHLYYFWHVYKEGSVVGAAEALFLTPQTITGQIKALEERLQGKLFKRKGRGLEPSELGELVFRYADRMFTLSQEMLDIVNYRKESNLLFDVGVADALSKRLVSGVLDAAEKGTPGEMKMPPEMIKAVCDAAHKRGYTVAAHTESPAGVKAALENGVDSIEHGAKMDEETVRLYKERGAFLCTTISPALPYALFDTAVSGASEKDQYNGKIVFDGVIESAKTALANGIPVGLGNDVGCPYITQYDFWRELCYFHKYCGVSNRFALYTATLRNAQLAGIGDVTGSIVPGKSADFIVTRENPLEDLRALQHLELVVCRGRAVKKPSPKRKKEVDALLDPYLV